MKQGRLHTGPPLALQPLQAEMARKKSLPQDETTQDKSHVVTVTTCDSEHSIQGAVLRPLCKSYDLCYTYTRTKMGIVILHILSYHLFGFRCYPNTF